ncbi:hypothetical protein FGB62_92g020 [Gracilaria domingensis]|nr:hypothetical protein FGB62_92g020 [Gracilaria domingensis]
MILSSLRACYPSLQSPCLSVSATLVFFTICAFHLHRLAVSNSLPLEAGLRKLVLPGSLHASDPPLASPVDASTVVHHARVYGASPFSHNSHDSLLYSTLQSSRQHSLPPGINLFHHHSPRARSPRALMRSSDRLYPVESHPRHNSFPLESEGVKYVNDDHFLVPHTHVVMSDSLHSSEHPAQQITDAARDNVHQVKQLQPVEQEASRRHPVIEAFHSLIGTSPQSKTLDTEIQSTSGMDLQTSRHGVALDDPSERPASVSATDLVASDDDAQAVRVSGSRDLFETDSEQTVSILDSEKQLLDDSTSFTSLTSSESPAFETTPVLREAAAMEDIAKLESPTAFSDKESDEQLNGAPKKMDFLNFLFGTSRSNGDLSDVVQERDEASINSVIKKGEINASGDVDLLAGRKTIEEDSEVKTF